MKKNLLILFFVICTIQLYAQTNDSESVKDETKNQSKIIYPAQNDDNYSAGNEWNLIWSDEFDGSELNLNNWTRQILPVPFNDEWESYGDSEENSYVDDGYLVLKAIHTSEVHGDKQYTSARLHTGGKHSWKYGKIVARIQMPYGMGMWPAFWMLGSNIDEIGGDTPWPKSGEIDIFELYGSKDDAVVEANIHYDDNGHKSTGVQKYKLEKGIFAENFHLFELEWDKNKITCSVDGLAFYNADITAQNMEEFHKEFIILLNVAVGGAHAGRPDNSTVFPQTMYVDWVRVFDKKN